MSKMIRLSAIFGSILALIVLANPHSAFAQVADLSDVSENMINSVEYLPRLLSRFAYLLGLLFAVSAIFKIKDHVERPGQTPLSEGLVRFLAGGALFALPIMTRAVRNTITGVNPVGQNTGVFTIFGFANSLFSAVPGAGAFINNINGLLENIRDSLESVPTLLGGVAYLLALLLIVSGILKVKEHVENPANVGLREPVIRFLVSGALFGLPTVMNVVQRTIAGNSTSAGITTALTDIIGFLTGYLGGANCDASMAFASLGIFGQVLNAALGGATGGPTLGGAVCQTVAASTVLPSFMTALSYLFGIVLVIWGLLKIKEHVLNPGQVHLWDGVIRLIAAGAFFALPYVAAVAKGTIGLVIGFSTTGFAGAAGADGLDSLMTRFTTNLYGPMLFMMNFFGYVAGTALVMIGISRLLKSSQEGPRGPGGLGTMMTFIAAGALLALAPMMGAFTGSLFGGSATTATYADLAYPGFSAAEEARVTAVISSILKFMIVIGFISFARGIFMMRSVAEGNQQVSLMAGMTHMIGGALAVNLGPFLNLVQNTFNIAGYGVTFGAPGP